MKNKINPISFTNEENVKPISFFGSKDKPKNMIVITKSTENGKYVVGNSIVYEYNGITIYADLDKVILIDTKNDTIFVRENKEDFVSEDNGEREYLICYVELEGDEIEKTLRWEYVTGRENAYINIKNVAPTIDIDKSIILASSVPFNNAISIREFCNYLKNGQLIEDDDFDINDFDPDYI